MRSSERILLTLSARASGSFQVLVSVGSVQVNISTSRQIECICAYTQTELNLRVGFVLFSVAPSLIELILSVRLPQKRDPKTAFSRAFPKKKEITSIEVEKYEKFLTPTPAPTVL